MAEYGVYSYEIQEGERNLMSQGKRVIEMANEIVGNILKDDFTVIGKKRKADQPLKILKFYEYNNVFTFILCNNKDLTQYEGHDKIILQSNPGCYVIVDNREDVCQILIEKGQAFDSDTDKVIKYLKRTFSEKLSDYGLKIEIKLKYQAGKFRELIRERIEKYNDHVKKVVWEFPNPDKIKGIDACQQMKDRLEVMKLITQATNALKGRLTLYGSPTDVMNVDDDKIADLAQIIALSAQNGYELSYYFYKTSKICMKNATHAYFNIDENVIREFENKETFFINDDNSSLKLIEVLDNIRKEINGYDNEKVIE